MNDDCNNAAEADVLIVGAGIAGASAAWFAAEAGRSVTLLDAGRASASQVPTALINPVRGYQGKLIPRGVEGARFTFHLIEQLEQRGHALRYGRGLWRPCPDAATLRLWRNNLASDAAVTHQWHEHLPAHLQLQGAWAGVMYLPDSGWVETAGLLAALRAHPRIVNLQAEVAQIEVAQIETAQKKLRLTDGRVMQANSLLWCGGAWGAARFGSGNGLRPGSLLLTDRPLGHEAVSFGLYGAPHTLISDTGAHAGTQHISVIGPTTEPITSAYDDGPSPTAWVERTIERARAMFAQPFEVASHWHGVRLETTTLPPGLDHLTGFGSRGYLLAPLLAWEWAQSKWAQNLYAPSP